MSVLFNKESVNSVQESSSQESVCLESFLTLGNEPIKLLHNRFGHPNKRALQTIIKKLLLYHV